MLVRVWLEHRQKKEKVTLFFLSCCFGWDILFTPLPLDWNLHHWPSYFLDLQIQTESYHMCSLVSRLWMADCGTVSFHDHLNPFLMTTLSIYLLPIYLCILLVLFFWKQWIVQYVYSSKFKFKYYVFNPSFLIMSLCF